MVRIINAEMAAVAMDDKSKTHHVYYSTYIRQLNYNDSKIFAFGDRVTVLGSGCASVKSTRQEALVRVSIGALMVRVVNMPHSKLLIQTLELVLLSLLWYTAQHMMT